MRNEHIVRYTLDEIREINRREAGIDWERARSITEEEIERLAFEENEELGVDHDWYKHAQPVNFQPTTTDNSTGVDYTEAAFADSSGGYVPEPLIASQAILTAIRRTRSYLVSIQGEYDSARLDSLVQ